jgi:ribosomal protein S18 acetylase RimI-like enzyme
MKVCTAHTAEHFSTIEALARRIVPDFYASFFERATGEYLVESGHTAAALAEQAGRGCRHFFVMDEERPVGYFSLAPDGADILLSHFYVLRECRGRGLGQLAMEFIDREVMAMGARRIELYVLRENAAAVGLYRKNGYIVAEEVLTRLGNGAVLEDYLMRKEVEN